MTAVSAAPWPDAAGRPRAQARAAAARHPRLTFLLGVFTVLVFSSTWVMFVTGPDGNTKVGALVIALYTPGYLAALVLLFQGGRDSVRALAASPLLWVLVGAAAASVLWSADPSLTQRRVPALVLTTLAGVALAARFDWPELAEVLAASFAVIIVGCFLLALLVPSWGRMTTLFPGAWRGLWNEKNALGGAMVKGFCLLVAAAALSPRRRWLWAGFALAALLLIQLSQSRTALVTAALGGAILGFVAVVRRGGAPAVVATFVAVIVLAALAFLVIFDSDKLFMLLGKDSTLTGRTQVWAAATRLIVRRPWLGYGYGAVWDDEGVWAPINWIVKEAGWRPHHAHNTWIELRLALGWVGFGGFVALMVQAWGRLLVGLVRGGAAGRGAWVATPFLATWLFQSFTESVGLNYNDFTWVMIAALTAALGLSRREAGADGAAP